jgi:hypothetical protein
MPNSLGLAFLYIHRQFQCSKDSKQVLRLWRPHRRGISCGHLWDDFHHREQHWWQGAATVHLQARRGHMGGMHPHDTTRLARLLTANMVSPDRQHKVCCHPQIVDHLTATLHLPGELRWTKTNQYDFTKCLVCASSTEGENKFLRV